MPNLHPATLNMIMERWRAKEHPDVICRDFSISKKELTRIVKFFATPEERLQHGVRRQFTDEELLDQIRNCAQALGRTPGSGTFDQWIGRHRAMIVWQRFGTWRNACIAASLTPNNPPPFGAGVRKYSEADLLNAYTRIKRQTNRMISRRTWEANREKDEASVVVIDHRYGGWAKFRDAMEEALTK